MDTSDAAHSLVIRDPLRHTPGIRVLVLLFTWLSLMEKTTVSDCLECQFESDSRE